LCLKRMATGRKRGGNEHIVGDESRTPVLIDVNVTVPAGRAYGANEMLWSAGMLSGTVLAGALVNAHAHLLFALLA